ncbi:hypothetical protein LQZ18_04160 [Lachnospiraceae bacterium ZAX-1]
MYREVLLENALKAYLAGDEVKILIPDDEDERAIPLGRYFNGLKFLVDQKPAKVNTEFDQLFEDTKEADTKKSKRERRGNQRIEIDYEKLRDLRESGTKGKEIAKIMGISLSTVGRNLAELKAMDEKRKRVLTKDQKGKIGALWKVGGIWTPKAIAGDMSLPIEAVEECIERLKEEKKNERG